MKHDKGIQQNIILQTLCQIQFAKIFSNQNFVLFSSLKMASLTNACGILATVWYRYQLLLCGLQYQLSDNW